MGSVRELIDGSGNIQARYDYDPYGRVTKIQGSTVIDADFQYAGMYIHQPSGFYLSATRAYSPNLGRWITKDPIQESGGLNMYAYCGNDPINCVDLLGLLTQGARDTVNQSLSVGVAVQSVIQGFDIATQNPNPVDFHWE